MSTTKKELSVPEKYLVRPGTTDSGKEYEINNISLLALKCCFEELEEFWIASNANGFGELDDIIMYKKRKQSDRGVAYLMQLKHQDGSKPLVTKMFLKDTGDFSFKKYSECYNNMQNKIETATENEMLAFLKQNSEMMFIIFTNKRVANKQKYPDKPATEKPIRDKPAMVVDFLIQMHEPSPILDDIGSDGDIFKINYEALTAVPDINEDFLQKLYLFTNQSHNYSMEEKIKKILKDNLGNKLQLSPDDVSDIVSKFGKFVGQWAKGHLGKHYPLTKAQILRKLVALLLFPYILIIDGEDYEERGEEGDIWYDITQDKDVTVIHDVDDIVLRFVRNVTNKIICNSDIVNSITNINRPLMRVASNSKNFSKSEKYELLWKTNNIPLVLEVANERGVTYIQEVLKKFPKIFRIIILNKTKTHFEEFGDINLFVNVSNLSTKHQEYILWKPIKFQGKEGSCIHKLNINLKSLKVKDVVYILCDQFNVGGQFKDVPQFFVEMSLTTHIFNIRLLKGPKDIFVVRCDNTILDEFESVLRNQLGIDAKRIIHWEKLNQADFNGQIVVFNDLETLQEIEAFCLTLTEPVHFLAWHGGGHADLIKSNHITENLKHHKSNSKKSIKELLQNFYENKQTLIISAIPGMGKSVLINYFALNMPINLLVLDILLAKYQDHYKNWEGQNSDSQQLNFERFLKEVLKAQQTPNIEIFNSVFNQFLNCKNVVFLLDGLDEVQVDWQNGAMQLIKFINKSGYYTCVTTRPLLQEQLESTLNTFAITLNMFSKDEQTSFLANYFANFGNVVPSNEKVKLFVYELLIATKANLNDFDHQFTGVPLQTTLLAEVFENDFLKYLDDGIFKNQCFNLIYLYEHFINKKIKIACAKVENISETMINFFKKCRALYGLRHLFDKRDLQEWNIDRELDGMKKLMPDVLQIIQKDGITVIDSDENVTFVHQTYAEYLVAYWLVENLNTTHKEIVRKLIKKTFASNFVVVRNMFDRILAKDCSLHTPLINRQFDNVETLLLDENAFEATDRGGRTILHLISAWGLHHSDLVKKRYCKTDDILTILDTIPKNKLQHVEDKLHYTPLDYAILSRSLGIANWLALEIQIPSCNVNISKNETDCILRHVKKSYSVSLYLIILKCFIRTIANELEINDIHKSFRNGDFDRIRSQISKKNVDLPDNKGCTLLHTATKNGQKDTVRFLLKRKANVNRTDNNGWSALHWASYLGHMEIISILLSKGAKPDATDCYNLTTYHYAILSPLENQADIVSLLLSRNRTIDIIEHLNYSTKVHPIYLNDLATQSAVSNLMLSRVNPNMKGWKGMTALMVAAEYDDVDSLNLLLANKADVHAEDDNYQTALNYAVRNHSKSAVTILLINNADANTKNSDNKTPLHLAAEWGNNDVVTILLTHGANRNATDSDNKTPLNRAEECGNKDVVTILLTHNADVGARDTYITTLLRWAVDWDTIDIQTLSAKVNTRDSHYRTRLHWAADAGYKGVVTILLNHSADVNVRDFRNKTPLHYAAEQNYKDIVTILLTHNADVNARDPYNKTPLHLAARWGYTAVVTILLAHSADVNVREFRNKTPLHYAVAHNYKDIITILLTHGADVNARDSYNTHPLLWSALSGHQDVVTILVAHHADVEARDSDNKTPLHYAALGYHQDVVNMLLTHDADVDAKDFNNKTPLHLAASQGQQNVVTILLTHGADVNVRDTDNKTPLHWAAPRGYTDVVTILLTYSADVEARDSDNKTPLHYAALGYHQDVVNILLTHDADVDAKDSNNKTPLHLAASQGQQNVVTILLTHGADVEARDSCNRTPLHLAVSQGNEDVVTILTNAQSKNK